MKISITLTHFQMEKLIECNNFDNVKFSNKCSLQETLSRALTEYLKKDRI